jgi:DNA-directed RNA polymerase alpha subunit
MAEPTTTTTLASLAEQASATGEWWKETALDAPNELVLPTRVLKALDNAGINTVEALKAAGPAKLREIPHLGKQGFELIIAMLRALDRQNGGEKHDHQSGQARLR